MRKFEELLDLIDTKHDEWRNLSIRKLSEVSGYSNDACRLALNEARPIKKQTPTQNIKKKTNSASPPPREEPQFIDDPDELLMSVAIRELNKPNPNPSWANILINCKKENISTKGDDIESFRKLPNQVLATLLNKSKQKMQ